jgi:hypothetical protein
VTGRNWYRATVSNQFDTRQEFVRGDYNASATWAFTGRYLNDRIDSRGEYGTGPAAAPNHRYSVGRLAVLEARRAGARVVLESSYQLSSHQQAQKDLIHTRADLGLVIPELFPENAANLIPLVEVEGLSSTGESQRRPREYVNHTFSSVLTLQRGTHTVKTGGLFAFERVNSNLVSESTEGAFVFESGGGFTGFQNFLRGNSGGACGDSCSYSETDTDVMNRFRSGRYELYVQDTWRIRPRITLDLGVRYAFYPPLTDDRNLLFTFSPEAYDPAQAPAFADPDGDFLVLGTGNMFNGIRVAGKNSPYGRAIYGGDTNNLQPRVGAAWDPGGTGRLFLRAGYGMYFDRTPVGVFAENVQSSSYDPFRTDLFISNPPLSNPGGGTVIKPFALYRPDTFAISDPFVAPRWQHWNIGVQRRLYARGVIDVGYVGSRGDHLLRYVDINQPQPAAVAAQGGAANSLPFRGYGAIILRETTARSRYHGLLASFRHETGRTGSATVNYTYSRNTADATYDNAWVDNPQNPLDKNAEFAAAGTDRTQIFNASYVYELPFARGGTTGWRKAVLGGWQIAGITRIETGPTARLQVVNCNYERSCLQGLRPNQVGDPGAGDQTGLLWFNPAAFVPSPAGEYGAAPVAPFRLPGRHQWDFAASKYFGLGGTRRLQFRTDLINAFNQRQFLDVNTTCGGTTTCDPRNGFGQVTSARPPREIQLGVRLDW